MAKTTQPVVKVSKLEQVCIAVHDIDKSAESMWNIFGLGPWSIYTRDAGSMSDMTYYGKPARFSYKVANLLNEPGGIKVELIQPVDGDNIFFDFLREHGESVHHFGWYVVDSLKDFKATISTLEKNGFPCIMSARTSNTAVAYINTTKVLNTILEVIWRDPSKSKPAGYVFPS